MPLLSSRLPLRRPARSLLLLSVSLCLIAGYYAVVRSLSAAQRQAQFRLENHPSIKWPPAPSRNDDVRSSPPHTVNLVVASQSSDDTHWASKMHPFAVIRYVNNDPSATYHPPARKGREALMYLTYLLDFYDKLPDITIFIHSDELAWHVEGTLMRNTSFALTRLNLTAVQERKYFNLRTTWRGGCPAWINVSKTFDDFDLREEPFVREAWTATFGADDEVPETIGGPCCSQFAVTREAIQSRPREFYRHSVDWFVQTELADEISGRIWEHFWPQVFLKQKDDCEFPERRSLCEMYGVCFANDWDLSQFQELWEERERAKTDSAWFRALWKPREVQIAQQKLIQTKNQIEREMQQALLRGNDATRKAIILKHFQT